MTAVAQWGSTFLWDLEWVDAQGTLLKEQHELNLETAERQAQVWVHDHPGSRVYLYRRRGEVTILVQVVAHEA